MTSYRYYALFLVGCLLLSSGCSTPKGVLPEPNPTFPLTVTDTDKVRLSPGDEIEIKHIFWPELDTLQLIRPDGHISLHYLDDVKVAGLTPQEVDAVLTEKYKKYLREPKVQVIVRFLNNRRVYVGGEVINQGAVLLKEYMTPMQAILSIGGLTRDSELRNVVLIRHHEGVNYATTLNLAEPLQTRQTQPVYLRPMDVIYVPKTRISQLNQWIRQHINDMVPKPGLSAAIAVTEDVIVTIGDSN